MELRIHPVNVAPNIVVTDTYTFQMRAEGR
jgi:hypothetical protein